MYSKSEISCAPTTLLTRGPTYKPIPLVVLLHGLSSPFIRTPRSDPDTHTHLSYYELPRSYHSQVEHKMNSLAHLSQQEYLQ